MKSGKAKLALVRTLIGLTNEDFVEWKIAQPRWSKEYVFVWSLGDWCFAQFLNKRRVPVLTITLHQFQPIQPEAVIRGAELEVNELRKTIQKYLARAFEKREKRTAKISALTSDFSELIESMKDKVQSRA